MKLKQLAQTLAFLSTGLVALHLLAQILKNPRAQAEALSHHLTYQQRTIDRQMAPASL